LLISRESEDDEADRVRRRDETFLYAMWIGLTVSGAVHAGDSVHYHDGGHGGGDFGGGFDGGAGGGGTF